MMNEEIFLAPQFESELNDQYKTVDEKLALLSETIVRIFNQCYIEQVNIIQTQILKLLDQVNEFKSSPHRLNYSLNKIINIQRDRVRCELHFKLDKLNDIVQRNLTCISLAKQLDTTRFNALYLDLIKSASVQLEQISKKIEAIYVHGFERLKAKVLEKCQTDRLTDYYSDTETYARSKLEHVYNKKRASKLSSSYTDSEIESVVKYRTFSWSHDAISEDDSSDLSLSQTNSRCRDNNVDEGEDDDDVLCLSSPTKASQKSQIESKYRSVQRIRPGMRVYALKDKTVFKWQPATLSHIVDSGSSSGTHVYRCKFEQKKQCGSAKRADSSTTESDDIDNGDAVDLESTFVAHSEPVDQDFVLPVKTRIVTLYQNENECRAPFFSVGTICEIPNARNLNRYLVFFDDGFAQYIQRNEAFQVFEPYMMPVNQINEHHLEFLYRYFLQYPEKAMMRLHKDNVIQANYKNKWYKTRVVNVDCSLVRLHFEGTEHSEWLYRGSYRLLPFYTRLKDETIDGQMFMFNIAEYKDRANSGDKGLVPYISKFASTIFPVMQNQTARKSTSSSMSRIQAQSSSTSSRTQGQTKFLDLFDVMVKPEIVRFKPHGCTSKCVQNWELNIENRVKSLNPLLIPMIYGWQRHVATQSKDSNTKNRRCVSYMAPCGRRLRNIKEVDKYLYYTNSQMTLDMFSFDSLLRTDRVFEANKTYVNIDDITDGKEDVPISCVNCMDDELPPTIDYSKVRLALDGVPLNTDESQLEGCDCTDGCKDRLKCSCWRKTYEATTFTGGKNNIDETVGYKGRRLLQMVSTGIFECNSRCKCDHRCSNRVVQNPISVRLQLFKTASKGWGLRCLDDVPKGGFLCVYTGQLLTEEQSDIRGMELGDEYFAELDFIECVRRSRIDQLEQSGELDDNNMSSMDINEMATITKTKTNYIKLNHQVPKLVQQTSENDDCIELSSDENDTYSPDNKQQTRIKEKFFTNSKNPFFYANYLRSSDVFIMDAKICGNIGRYFNHSCTPNIFVQNVFVDTYDLRFPWISFFSSQFIKAGTELCWDYNYTLDSVQGKQIKCHCGSSQCRGRLL